MRPALSDLYRLAQQLEADGEQSLGALAERDHSLALERPGTEADDDSSLLLYWLDRVNPTGDADNSLALSHSGWLLLLSRLLSFVLGFVAMAGFLLGSSRGLVNVLLLLAVFVLLQVLMSAFSLFGFVRTVSGHVATSVPVSPAHWLARRSVPDGRYLRESGAVVRLLYLRFAQEWGALFTLGAVSAFVLVHLLADFSFVWGSTFAVSAQVMTDLTGGLAWPWASLLPSATVAPEVIANSRFHPALVNLDRAGIEGMRGWWGFLFVSMLVYALLPRLLLWLGSRYCYPRLIRRSFEQYPGAERVLRRMRRPRVSTQASSSEEAASRGSVETLSALSEIATDGRLLLLDFSGLLASGGVEHYPALQAAEPRKRLSLGLGDLAADRALIAQQSGSDYDHLLVLVKSWEPPMAELADLLNGLSAIRYCSVYLLPLAGKPVPERKLQDWRRFTRELPFAAVDVGVLEGESAP